MAFEATFHILIRDNNNKAICIVKNYSQMKWVLVIAVYLISVPRRMCLEPLWQAHKLSTSLFIGLKERTVLGLWWDSIEGWQGRRGWREIKNSESWGWPKLPRYFKLTFLKKKVGEWGCGPFPGLFWICLANLRSLRIFPFLLDRTIIKACASTEFSHQCGYVLEIFSLYKLWFSRTNCLPRDDLHL